MRTESAVVCENDLSRTETTRVRRGERDAEGYFLARLVLAFACIWAAVFSSATFGSDQPSGPSPYIYDVRREGSNITIYFQSNSISFFQTAPSVNGPWQTVTNAISPYRLQPLWPMQVFRVAYTNTGIP